jgi:hypothetical protein
MVFNMGKPVIRRIEPLYRKSELIRKQAKYVVGFCNRVGLPARIAGFLAKKRDIAGIRAYSG